ncbi:LamG domain-containing protein [Duganella sp. CF458]|uniref:LamG domain-containing protein n=1 Tax=Duganella sp. CF458 TaxID=1884368 RepID=UPI001E509138|nr:LamG domain-containing protein [Duganella sp. CF458]
MDCRWALPRASWFHIAVTLSGSLCTVYVNGAAVGSNTGMMLTPAQIGHTDQNWIGRSQRDGEPYFSGSLDDFRIYHGALSASQVTAVMNGQSI